MFEIGYSLRSARERQGIGLPEAELATKIRAKYIRALEEEDFEALPADTYARGFLRAYADYLGLDGEIYVEEYASRFHNAEWDDGPGIAQRSRPRRPRRERTIERRAVVLALAGIAVLTALFFVAWRYGNTRATCRRSRSITGSRRCSSSTASGGGRSSSSGEARGRAISSSAARSGLAGCSTFSGKRFYVHARRHAGVRITRPAGVTLLGG